MRKSRYKSNSDLALALFTRAPVIRLATTAADGSPILRALHGVVVDNCLAFHSAPVGEKMQAMGREGVVAAEEIVATIPSYFFDPQRACPATTYYLSAQAKGAVEAVDCVDFKSRVLSALMDKYQPEGGFVPLDPSHTLYRKSIASLSVARISLATIVAKAKLGQNLKTAQKRQVLEQLWARGQAGDPKAIDTIIEHSGADCVPDFLRGAGWRLRCSLPHSLAESAATLVQHEYWNVDVPFAAIAQAHCTSPAWIGAVDDRGRLIGSARAVGDVSKHAHLLDLVVAPTWRGRGIGTSLLRLLLEHPAVRSAQRVWLRTQDAHSFYARFGFGRHHRTSSESTEMVLDRSSLNTSPGPYVATDVRTKNRAP